eukprot:Anaeramoba_flamelloidesc39174_g1_i2.p1 GENE.c39174_g1_i2~~c39174_g1_i2.p1  ORF type:complete len:159 (-),score=34.98 c39174_g1_i2:69-545(-)
MNATLFVFLVLLILPVSLTQECTEKDYRSKFTKCESNERQAVYYWNEPKTCEGGVTLPESYQTTHCNCTLQDYEILYSQCTDQSRNKTYVKKTDCVDGITPPQPEEGIPCECVDTDYSGIYTECINNTRDLFWHWNDPKVCEGGEELPQNVLDLECGK